MATKDYVMRRITEQDQKTLDFIVEFEKLHLFPPSIREICEGCGISSPSTIHQRLRKLEDFGKIRIDENGRIMIIGYQIIKKPEHEKIVRHEWV